MITNVCNVTHHCCIRAKHNRTSMPNTCSISLLRRSLLSILIGCYDVHFVGAKMSFTASYPPHQSWPSSSSSSRCVGESSLFSSFQLILLVASVDSYQQRINALDDENIPFVQPTQKKNTHTHICNKVDNSYVIPAQSSVLRYQPLRKRATREIWMNINRYVRCPQLSLSDLFSVSLFCCRSTSLVIV